MIKNIYLTMNLCRISMETKR